MTRVTNAVASRKRRKKLLKRAKGFFGDRKNHYRTAKNAVMKALAFSYAHRKKKKSDFQILQDNKEPLTDEERKECLEKKAVWHHSTDNNPSAAVWKSVDGKGKVTYITNTHRAYNTAPTLK